MYIIGQPVKGSAYRKAKEAIMGQTFPIHSVSQLKGIRYIGSSVLKKLQEYIDTGKIKVLEKAKQQPLYTLAQVYGIGPKKAKELVEVHGIKTIKELREKQADILNKVQRKGLMHYEDLQKRIPRDALLTRAARLTRHCEA